MNMKQMTIDELRAGLRRCQARSDGILSYFVMTKQQNEDAIREYKKELNRRNKADLFEK